MHPDDEPLDFSGLNPRRDAKRFDDAVRDIVQEGMSFSPFFQVFRAARAMFAPVMALSLALILAAVLWMERGGARPALIRDAPSNGAMQLLSWTLDGGQNTWQDVEDLGR